MNILFLDTTHNLSVGILNEKFEWRDYRYFNQGKSATKLHQSLHDLFKDHNLKLKDFDLAVQVAGPGSYTGMRVSDGFFQTLKLFGMKTHSIYHFDVLQLLNIENAQWIANAFKGEIFSFKHHQGTGVQNLYLEKEFISDIEQNSFLNSSLNLYTHFNDAFSPTFKLWAQDKKIQETSELIKIHSQKVFSQITSLNIEKSLFYYREIDQEFKKPN
jgi:tRNA threonylcarbamoyladenosine biosynthesis protein TsaB